MAIKGKTDAEVLDGAVALLTSVPDTCCFWACPGPDARFVHMATCVVCAAVQDLRKLQARMGRRGR